MEDRATTDPPARPDLTDLRIHALTKVADAHRTVLSPHQLTELLPANGPSTPTDLDRWIAARSGTAPAAPVGSPPFGEPFEPLEDRRARGVAFLAEADRLRREALAPTAGLVRFLGVTGSTAYGEPQRQDDLDLMAVTTTGSLWLFLTTGFALLRLERLRRRGSGQPDPCLNYVLDDSAARQEFSRPQGFLFAREALMTRPLVGEPYYRGLIGGAPWLRQEVPRLLMRWERDGLPSVNPEARASVPVRLLNAILFPLLGSVIQAQAIVRNWRLRRSGRSDKAYRVVTRLDRMTVDSVRFDELTQIYRPASATHPST